MRDSRLKRLLVRHYFNAQEIRNALRGMSRNPALGAAIDYDTYWRHRERGEVQPRYDIIGACIAPPASLLDVGCGDGAMLEYFAARGIQGVGIDVSMEAVARARARGVEAGVATLGGVAARGERFDHVVLSEVLEHVADAEAFINDAWSITRRSLWVTFPNIAYFPHRLRLLSGKFPVQWVVFAGEHLRFWSACDFERWIRSLQMPRPQLTPSNGLTTASLHRLWPNLFANQIVARMDR